MWNMSSDYYCTQGAMYGSSAVARYFYFLMLCLHQGCGVLDFPFFLKSCRLNSEFPQRQDISCTSGDMK